ncbi:MAG: aconitate hydratase AcnA, partial [Acidimicrobiales bacterium]
PLTMLVPPVVGLKLTGALPEGATATDLVLTIAELLRRHGVVGKFVEVYGPGLAELPAENRATIGNMAPEYGATCVIFPVDAVTLGYLRLSGRDEQHVRLVEAYTKEQGMFHEPGAPEPVFSEYVELELSTVEPSLAGPARPQDRVALPKVKDGFHRALATAPGRGDDTVAKAVAADGTEISDGHVVIAAITSCTNTSNPQVMLAAGLLARNALSRGLTKKPWVKTSLAPGSRVVMDYYDRAGLTDSLSALGFDLVGFGCTTCIGNSGPLLPGVSDAVRDGDLAVAAVLSGNRNFEGRIHPDVRLNYLASPPLVVAYALAGSVDVDLTSEPIGHDAGGGPVYLRDIWPTTDEVLSTVRQAVDSEMYRRRYSAVFDGDDRWRSMEIGTGNTFGWDATSTYVLQPPFFEAMQDETAAPADIVGARVLVMVGDSVTTDHISPAGSIKPSSPAGLYLAERGVTVDEFNSYGARRGNHEVMMRGTFANVRLRNQLAPGTEGGVTRHLPDGEQMTIFDASVRYAQEGTPLLVVAGKEYGSGSSRDWAAKGPALLGVRAAIAQSYERIHRSNLIGMGILPLQFEDGQSLSSYGLSGEEAFDIVGLDVLAAGDVPKQLMVRAGGVEFPTRVRIDTPMEAEYYRHGGILPYVLRQLAH